MTRNSDLRVLTFAGPELGVVVGRKSRCEAVVELIELCLERWRRITRGAKRLFSFDEALSSKSLSSSLKSMGMSIDGPACRRNVPLADDSDRWKFCRLVRFVADDKVERSDGDLSP